MDARPTTNRRGRRVIAALLSLDAPGLGQMAIGHWRRGILWFGGAMTLAVVGVVCILAGKPGLLWPILAASIAFRIASMVDTLRLERPAVLPGARGIALIVLGVLVSHEVMAGRLRRSVVEAFEIPTASMYPTLEIGDHIWVSKLSRTFHRGDVVVFLYPLARETKYIKRIAAIGGDSVEIRRGILTVNGRPVEREATGEPCHTQASLGCTIWLEHQDGRTYRVATGNGHPAEDLPPRMVPGGSVYVLSDNRETPDSRVYGPIAEDLVLGKATHVFWSRNAAGVRWDRLDQPIR
jgi:signal peptidase I